MKTVSHGLVKYEKLKPLQKFKNDFHASNFKTVLGPDLIERSDGIQFLSFRNVNDFVLFDENFLYNFEGDRMSKIATNYATEDLCSFDCSENFCAAGSWNGEVSLWKLDDEELTAPKIQKVEIE